MDLKRNEQGRPICPHDGCVLDISEAFAPQGPEELHSNGRGYYDCLVDSTYRCTSCGFATKVRTREHRWLTD